MLNLTGTLSFIMLLSATVTKLNSNTRCSFLIWNNSSSELNLYFEFYSYVKGVSYVVSRVSLILHSNEATNLSSFVIQNIVYISKINVNLHHGLFKQFEIALCLFQNFLQFLTLPLQGRGTLQGGNAAGDCASGGSCVQLGGGLYQQALKQLHMATTGKSRLNQT